MAQIAEVGGRLFAAKRPFVAFDEENSSLPLPTWDLQSFTQCYLPEKGGEASEKPSQSAAPPCKPQDFKDPYLFPSLSKEERERLKRFYLLTEAIDEDDEVMEHLSEIVSLVREGYEMVNLGFSDLDTYIQVLTEGLPALIIPRRESICSHTILQDPGTIFEVPDLEADWRFANHPHVVKGGLRSYAGTQLVYEIPGTKQSIALGTLCLLGRTTMPPLSAAQRGRLIKFAKVIVNTVVSRAHINRQDHQRQRVRLLTELSERGASSASIVDRCLALLRTSFKSWHVTYQQTSPGHVFLPGEGDMALSLFENDVWENTAEIDEYISGKNHELFINGDRTLRAIACRVDEDHHLVLTAHNLQAALDDEADSLFVRSVGMCIANQQQAERLQAAIQAKQSFLRGVQHSLRTSLNGILSASEMLLDEAGATVNGTAKAFRRPSQELTNRKPGSQKDLLTIIDSSGRGLLAIINNLLRFQTVESLSPKAELCSIFDLEEQVMTLIIQSCSMEKLGKVTIVADIRLPDHIDTVIVDTAILRQILAILLQNAVDATEEGSIEVVFDRDSAGSLTLDVIDTGRGLTQDTHERIFEPFEKADAFTPTAGLGLSFAMQYADSIGGAVKLVKSAPDQGSVFRFELPDPITACARTKHAALFKMTSRWTYWTDNTVKQHSGCNKIFETFERYGWKKASQDSADIIIDASMHHEDEYSASLEPHQILFKILSAKEPASASSKLAEAGRIVLCGLPLYRNRIVSCFQQLAKFLEQRDGQVALSRSSSAMTFGSDTFKRPGESLRLLLVDDNDFNLKILQTFCKKRSFQQSSCMDGVSAYERYVQAAGSEKPYTFCIMDMQMPHCDGCLATRKIRAYEQEHQLQPCLIYMVTGQSGEDERAAAMAAGCDGFYVKPLRIKILDELLVTQFEV